MEKIPKPSGHKLPYFLQVKWAEKKQAKAAESASASDTMEVEEVNGWVDDDKTKRSPTSLEPPKLSYTQLTRERQDDLSNRSFSAKELEERIYQTTATMVDLQRQLYWGEEVYYEDTQAHGNIFRGWDGLVDLKDMGSQAAASMGPPRRIHNDNRWFSGSCRSVTRTTNPIPPVRTRTLLSSKMTTLLSSSSTTSTPTASRAATPMPALSEGAGTTSTVIPLLDAHGAKPTDSSTPEGVVDAVLPATMLGYEASELTTMDDSRQSNRGDIELDESTGTGERSNNNNNNNNNNIKKRKASEQAYPLDQKLPVKRASLVTEGTNIPVEAAEVKEQVESQDASSTSDVGDESQTEDEEPTVASTGASKTSKSTASSSKSKKRGRPPKSAAAAGAAAPAPPPEPQQKRRGRPPKSKAKQEEDAPPPKPPKKRRGRPPKGRRI